MKAIRWMPPIIAAVAFAGFGVATLLPSGAPISGTAPSDAIPSASVGATAPATPTAPAPTPTPALESESYIGPSYDLNFVSSPTASESQSKLWFHDGSWWAVMVSQTTSQNHIHALDWETQRWVDTGVLVDERPFVQVDVLWDGEQLYVASAGPRHAEAHAGRVIRFSYDPTARRYALAPDFPVRVNEHGVQAMTIAKTQDDEIWLTFIADQRVYVSRSSSDGITWGSPFIPPVDELRAAADRAALVARAGELVLVWTNQHDDAVYAAVHRDGAPDDAWTVHSTPVEGLAYGEDQLSVRALSDAAGGSIFAAVRTSLDRVPNRNADAAQIVVVQLDTNGTWRQYLFGRVREGHTSPHLVLDESHDRAFVFAEADGDIYFKTMQLSDGGFSSGLGTRLIEGNASDGPQPTASPSPDASGQPDDEGDDPPLPFVADVTATKQGTDGLTELILLASVDGRGRYVHAAIALPGSRLPSDARGHLIPAPPDLQGGLPEGVPTFLVRDTFAPLEPGPAAATGWTTPADLSQSLTVSEVTVDDPSLRLTTTVEGDGVRACKKFALTDSGVVTARANVQLVGQPESDATITALRSAGTEVAAVRFGSTGTLRYFDGDIRIRTQVPYQPSLWYSSTVSVNLGTQTYEWELSVLGSTSPLLTVDDVPLRRAADSLDQICVDGASGLGDVELYVDDVTVDRRSGD